MTDSTGATTATNAATEGSVSEVCESQTLSSQALSRLGSQLRWSLGGKSGVAQRQGRSRRLENVWLLCWILKDLGWVALCAPLALPAGALALVLQGQYAFRQLEAASTAECAHSLATFGWLLGNCTWMTAQLFFESTVHNSRISPWYAGSIFAGSENRFVMGARIMQAIDVVALLGLICFYGQCAHEAGAFPDWIRARLGSVPCPTHELLRDRRNPVSADAVANERRVFGLMTPDVYSKIFIVPLILRDLFWHLESFYLTIFCTFVVIGLLADNFAMFEKSNSVPLLLWSLGSAVWICDDLVIKDKETWPMLLTMFFFAVAAGSMVGAIFLRHPLDGRQKNTTAKDEYTTLL